MREKIEINDITIKEAAAYFNIVDKRMRRIAENHIGELAIFEGNRYLVIQCKAEECFLNQIKR